MDIQHEDEETQPDRINESDRSRSEGDKYYGIGYRIERVEVDSPQPPIHLDPESIVIWKSGTEEFYVKYQDLINMCKPENERVYRNIKDY